jgi:hypothetical protein
MAFSFLFKAFFSFVEKHPDLLEKFFEAFLQWAVTSLQKAHQQQQ